MKQFIFLKSKVLIELTQEEADSIISPKEDSEDFRKDLDTLVPSCKIDYATDNQSFESKRVLDLRFNSNDVIACWYED